MAKYASILLCILLFSSCASEQEKADPLAFGSAPLFGMVYDEDNQPCNAVELTVDGTPGPVSDIRGRFVLADLTRGDHSITARKAGYEELDVEVSFIDRTFVLYLRMTSLGQLMARAERSLEEKRWDEAEALLERAEKLDSEDTVLLYLFAILSYKTGKYSEAVDYLSSILSRGGTEPHVYLFLADLYEQRLGDPAKAIENLKAYLLRRSDLEVEKRLADLESRLAK